MKWQRCPLCVSVPVWLLSALGVLLTNHMFPRSAHPRCAPDLLVYVFATWLMLWTLCSRCRTLPAPVRFIARHSFGLYLAHPMVLRLWNVWTTHHDPVIYLRLPQMYLLGFGGGLAAAVLLSFLPFGTLLGGAKRTKKTIPNRRFINGKKKNDEPKVYKEHPSVDRRITDTLRENYMPYAMSVIVSRAIPEIDGFKPSHRKLLYTMYKWAC